MIDREKLLDQYIRPYVYQLVKVCSKDENSLVKEWEKEIERSWKEEHHKGNLHVFAFIYLAGFNARYDRKKLENEDVEKEFGQFVFLFEVALEEFHFFSKDILAILAVISLRLKSELGISKVYEKYEDLLKEHNIEETSKDILGMQSKITPVDVPLEETILEDEDDMLDHLEIKTLTKIWIKETSNPKKLLNLSQAPVLQQKVSEKKESPPELTSPEKPSPDTTIPEQPGPGPTIPEQPTPEVSPELNNPETSIAESVIEEELLLNPSEPLGSSIEPLAGLIPSDEKSSNAGGGIGKVMLIVISIISIA